MEKDEYISIDKQVEADKTSSAKNRLDFRFSNVNANNPPAGLIAVNTVRVDITVNVI